MKLFRSIIYTTKKITYSLENSKTSIGYFVMTFLFAVNLRNFLESYIESTVLSLESYTHFYLFYIALALMLILFFHLTTKTKIIKITKIVLISFIIINLAPLIDYFPSQGKGYKIDYIQFSSLPNFIEKFLTFFGDFNGIGITPGIRIEIFIVLIGSFLYLYLKNLNLIKSLFFTSIIYTIIFIFCGFPNILKMSTITNIIYFYLFIILLTSIILFYLNNRKFFKIFVKDVRLLRLAHYELMFILGILLALKLNYSSKNILMFSNINNIFYISSILIAIAFAWLYSIITNNIEDYEIDKVSNKNRPLIKYKINFEEYEKLKWPLLFFALIFSIKASFNVFIFILIFIGNYFLYSMPPFRLKRITFFSKLFISANSLILVMLGFIISSKISLYEIKTPFETLTPIFLIGFTAAINFIDIKDYEGDKKAGIKTLPVILGLKKSKFLIGLFFILTYFSFYFFFKNIYLIIPLITLGIIQFYLINKKNYNENHVLLFYLVSIIALIIYLIFYTKVFSIMFY